jgi:hypothetical protein
MPAREQNLRHDLTALYAFVDSIALPVSYRTSSEAYTPAAVRFFDYVENLATVTKAHVAAWKVADDDEFEDRREELGTIRAAWKELHKFIKPALDADTLHVPSAVVEGIVRRFREIPKYSGAGFAIFHTSEFNYVQVRTADLRRVSAKLKGVIPGAPDFPSNLGLIGIPYSQGTTVFSNCLLAHEIGHFVFRDGNFETVLQAEVDAAFKSILSKEEPGSYKDRLDGWIKIVCRWAEEVFCDLFGVLLVGPCYTYAYLEAYDIQSILGVDSSLSEERLLPRLEFYDLYPSEVFRIQQQANLLRESRWWDHISRTSSHLSTLLSPIRDLSEEDHLKQNSKIDRLLKALYQVLPEIRRRARETVSAIDDGFTSFNALNAAIQTYLQNGVVPSSLNFKADPVSGGAVIHPSPVVLLNAGLEFYLTRISDLMRSIPGEDENVFERRLHWVRRVEQWVEKAIEDEYIMRKASDDSPVQN